MDADYGYYRYVRRRVFYDWLYADKMLLYATGEGNITPDDYAQLDPPIKALLMNHELAHDRYVRNKFLRSITKKKKESYMGSLLINANYQFMVSDPYYQACHIFGLEQEPLLKEGEYYSEYWLKRNCQSSTGHIRSPIVHHSELNILNFRDDEQLKYWYQYLHSGIVFPANGVGMDCAIHGGADFDGDLICTINNPIMIKGKQDGLPIMYESSKTEKKIIDSVFPEP